MKLLSLVVLSVCLSCIGGGGTSGVFSEDDYITANGVIFYYTGYSLKPVDHKSQKVFQTMNVVMRLDLIKGAPSRLYVKDVSSQEAIEDPLAIELNLEDNSVDTFYTGMDEDGYTNSLSWSPEWQANQELTDNLLARFAVSVKVSDENGQEFATEFVDGRRFLPVAGKPTEFLPAEEIQSRYFSSNDNGRILSTEGEVVFQFGDDGASIKQYRDKVMNFCGEALVPYSGYDSYRIEREGCGDEYQPLHVTMSAKALNWMTDKGMGCNFTAETGELQLALPNNPILTFTTNCKETKLHLITWPDASLEIIAKTSDLTGERTVLVNDDMTVAEGEHNLD